jgi:hypothetical protein
MITFEAIRKGTIIIDYFGTNVTFSLGEIETANSSLQEALLAKGRNTKCPSKGICQAEVKDYPS